MSFTNYRALGQLCLLLFACLVYQLPFAEDVPPNVLLVILDDVGVDQMSLYGAPVAAATPTITRIAESGVRFDDAWAHPYCSTTRASLYTGLPPYLHGVGQAYGQGSTPPLNAEISVLSGDLQAKGYNSALFGKWHLGGHVDGDPAQLRPVPRGWKYYAGNLSGRLPDYYRWEKITEEEGEAEVELSKVTRYATHESRTDAANWLAAAQFNAPGTPWWLTFSANAPHSPYQLPPEDCYTEAGQASDLRYLYRTMLECVDQQLGMLLDTMKADQLDHTLLIVVGDNGTPEEITEGDPDKVKTSVYSGGVHVPLVMAWGSDYRQLQRRDLVVSDPVQVSDLHATVAELAGLTVPDATQTLATSLLGYLDDGAIDAPRGFHFAQTFQGSNASATVADGVYKLNYHRSSKQPAGCYELFELAVDPGEILNLYNETAGLPEQEALIERLRQQQTGLVLAPEFPASAAACS